MFCEAGRCFARLRRRQGAAHPVACEVDGTLLDERSFQRAGTDSPVTDYLIQTPALTMKKICILGVNGFIGHHLSKRIIDTTDWEVYGMDMQTDRSPT